LPNQRGFFNFIPLKFSINSGIGGFVAIASAPASPDLTRYYGIKSAPSSRYRLFGKAFIPESLFVAHIPVPLGSHNTDISAIRRGFDRMRAWQAIWNLKESKPSRVGSY
jgi:hypothetical protein